VILTKFHAPKLVELPRPPSLAVRDERITAHLYLVESVAKSLVRKLPPCFELDDLKGAGYIGLIHAAEHYQASRKVPFENYARRRILDAMRDSIRRRNWRDATVPGLEETVAQFDLGLKHAGFKFSAHRRDRQEELIPDPGLTPEQVTQQSQDSHAILNALQDLDPRERAVIHLIYVRGETVTTVSRRMGVHHTYVSQLRIRGVEHMRRHFALRGRKAA
jgi:RNA polymerase sigma factor (sigma-70 family)